MAFTVQHILTKIFGSRNDRLLKRYRTAVAQVNQQEEKVSGMTDAQLRERTAEIRKGIADGKIVMADVVPEALAIIRESMDRNIGIRQIFNPEEDPMAKFDPEKFSDEELDLYDEVQRRMIQTGEPWTHVPIPPALYKAVRRVYPESRPPYRARCFDVQVIGGLVLYEGKIAEMATGEGKTFVAPLACFLRVLEGMRCHVVTVNDYLVRRDASWVRPAFEALGISVGFIQSEMEPGGDHRRKMYECDITYGTNSEFGFDYLRDNMKERVDLQVQGRLDFAIVDEVDSILIDEARTPLIISGAARDDAQKYRDADAVARKVIELHKPYGAVEREVDAAKRQIKAAEGDMDKHKKDPVLVKEAEERKADGEKKLEEAEKKKVGLTQYYEVELDRKSVHLTHEGIQAAQDFAGVGSFFAGNNMEWPHLMEQALRAHVVYQRDKEYVIERGQRTGQMEVVIVDEYTGRKMTGRQWSEGLHQAVEAKEKVPIKEETQTLATITLQNFFKLYKALAGMTGTAQTEAEEFAKIYKLEVVSIPTNRPVIRKDNDDRVYRKAYEKWEAIIEEIKLISDAGRPVLVGTTSVEKSEMLSTLLMRKYGIEHEVLNAKQHEREASIVAKAGQQHTNRHGEIVGNVTIATNMAGRGTDIKLVQETLFDIEPDAESKDAAKKVAVQRGTGKRIPFENNPDSPYYVAGAVKVSGGLHVIGTERHTARRIDNQLRGRGGRQGDPGSSRFYVSLEDELMHLFAGEWTIRVLGWLGMEEGMAIEDKRITKGIVRAQKKVEERNFLARKNLLEYDEVNDFQRTQFYGMRQRVLEGRDIEKIIWDMIGQSIADAVRKYIEQDYVAAVCCEWTKTNFGLTNLEADDFRGYRSIADLEAFIKGQAMTEVEHTLNTYLDEYMGEDREAGEWDTKGLSAFAMNQFQVQLSQTAIKKMTLEDLELTLKEKAVEQIEKRDCSDLTKYLEPLYAERELAQWAKDKFAITVDPDDMVLDPVRHIRKPVPEIVRMIEEEARQAYLSREIEYPVDHILGIVFGDAGASDNPYAADYVRQWAWAKFRVELSIEEIVGNVRRLRDRLIGLQQEFLSDGRLDKDIDAILGDNKQDAKALAKAFNERFLCDLTPEEVVDAPRPLFDPHRLPTLKAHAKVVVETDPDVPLRDRLRWHARRFLRAELTQLEQFVLISIFDNCWKDHLYAMDMLRQGIGLVSFAEKDPRIVFKKEGYKYFTEMMEILRGKVTDLIFRARLSAGTQVRSAYNVTAATHEDAGGYGVGENVQRVGTGAEQAEGAEGGAAAAGGDAPVTKPIVREAPKVGRNDPCPCGSGKKYKKCCGQNVA